MFSRGPGVPSTSSSSQRRQSRGTLTVYARDEKKKPKGYGKDPDGPSSNSPNSPNPSSNPSPPPSARRIVDTSRLSLKTQLKLVKTVKERATVTRTTPLERTTFRYVLCVHACMSAHARSSLNVSSSKTPLHMCVSYHRRDKEDVLEQRERLRREAEEAAKTRGKYSLVSLYGTKKGT